MNRQLRMGGGIMDVVPRDKFFLGKVARAAKKVVKKATGAVKDIASSDLGKAALIGAAAFGIPGTSIGGLLGRSSFMVPAGGAPGIFGFGGIGNALAAGKTALGIGGESTIGTLGNLAKGPNALKLGESVSKNFLSDNIGKLATLGAVSTFLTGTLGMTPEQAEEELARDPSGYLEQYYRNLNPPGDKDPEVYEAEVRDFVTTNTSEYAVGGRVGFAEGTYKDFEEFMMRRSESMSERQKEEFRKQFEMYMRSKDPTVEAAEGGRIGFADGPVLPPDPTQPVNPFGPKPGDFGIEEDIPIKMASNMENDKILEALFEKYIDMGLSPKDAAEAAQKEFDKMSMGKTEGRGLAAIGGKMDTASDNAMQAAGIEGLPIRQNPKGVKELDLRDNGGFIPPVGIKEKEDDIPAMLSNNEFVFTADAVRGMGEGNVNVGAQRMYDMMKKLEAGGRV
jgi:hypothetical protein